jgi:hypothetical protein
LILKQERKTLLKSEASSPEEKSSKYVKRIDLLGISSEVRDFF